MILLSKLDVTTSLIGDDGAEAVNAIKWRTWNRHTMVDAFARIDHAEPDGHTATSNIRTLVSAPAATATVRCCPPRSIRSSRKEAIDTMTAVGAYDPVLGTFGAGTGNWPVSRTPRTSPLPHPYHRLAGGPGHPDPNCRSSRGCRPYSPQRDAARYPALWPSLLESLDGTMRPEPDRAKTSCLKAFGERIIVCAPDRQTAESTSASPDEPLLGHRNRRDRSSGMTSVGKRSHAVRLSSATTAGVDRGMVDDRVRPVLVSG